MKKVVLSLVALGCLSMVSFAQDFLGAPAELDPQINANLKYAVENGAPTEASATLVAYTITNDEVRVINKTDSESVIYFCTRLKNKTKSQCQSAVGRFYKYNGFYKLCLKRTDWEHAYDEVMPGWTRRHISGVAEQKIVVKRRHGKEKAFKLADPNTLWPHKHMDRGDNEYTIVTLGR